MQLSCRLAMLLFKSRSGTTVPDDEIQGRCADRAQILKSMLHIANTNCLQTIVGIVSDAIVE